MSGHIPSVQRPNGAPEPRRHLFLYRGVKHEQQKQKQKSSPLHDSRGKKSSNRRKAGGQQSAITQAHYLRIAHYWREVVVYGIIKRRLFGTNEEYTR